MMRFRNRFKAETASVRACEDCGLRISTTIGDGREMQIHEFPLCEPFKVWMKMVAALPDGKLHETALAAVDEAAGTGEVFELPPVGKA